MGCERENLEGVTSSPSSPAPRPRAAARRASWRPRPRRSTRSRARRSTSPHPCGRHGRRAAGATPRPSDGPRRSSTMRAFPAVPCTCASSTSSDPVRRILGHGPAALRGVAARGAPSRCTGAAPRCAPSPTSMPSRATSRLSWRPRPSRPRARGSRGGQRSVERRGTARTTIAALADLVVRLGESSSEVQRRDPRRAVSANFEEVQQRVPDLARARSLGLASSALGSEPWSLEALVDDTLRRHRTVGAVATESVCASRAS